MADSGSFCLSCGKSTKDKCSRCHSGHYCSKECFKADWPTHNLLCRAYSKFDLTSRPSKEHFLAIIFQQDKSEPHLTWLHCTRDSDQVDVPDLKPHLFPEGQAPIQGYSVGYNAKLDRELLNTVHVECRDEFFLDGSLPNRAVRATTKKPGTAHFDWRGTILAYSTVGNQEMRCRDIDLLDFHHCVQSFRARSAPLDSMQANAGGRVQAVRINCQGAQTTYDVPPFEAITIPLGVFFLVRDSPSIPARIGHPLLTITDPHDSAWKGANPATNTAAASLHLSCSDNKTWGKATAPCDDQEVGSVLVARANLAPLHPLYVKVLVRFCELEIAPQFEASLPRQVILAGITKSAFEAFRVRHLHEELEGGSAGTEGV